MFKRIGETFLFFCQVFDQEQLRRELDTKVAPKSSANFASILIAATSYPRNLRARSLTIEGVNGPTGQDGEC